MHPPTTHRHDHRDEDGPVTVDELLAVAAAMGVLRPATAPAVATHSARPGHRVPAWLLRPRPARRRRDCRGLVGRYVGLVGGAAATAAILGVPLLWAALAAVLGAVLGTAAALVGGVR